LSQFKKYHLSGNLKFNNFGIFQSLKLRILVENILPVSLKLNFTPNLGLLWVETTFFLEILSFWGVLFSVPKLGDSI